MYSRRRKLTLMPAVALAALGALVAVPALSSSRFYAAGPQRFVTVTVHRGDTMWTLASGRTPSGGNVQDTVDTILAANHLDSAVVVPGQHLKIPH